MPTFLPHHTSPHPPDIRSGATRARHSPRPRSGRGPWPRILHAGGLLLLPLLLGCSGLDRPTTRHFDTLDECHAAVDSLLSRWQDDEAPGAMTMVIHRGEVVYERGYGLADVGAGRPIGPHTIFRLASVSKQFTAMAILLLYQDGALDLEDPMVRHLPELEAYGPDITLRHLLHHTAGLPDYYETLESRAAQWNASAGDLPDNTDALALLEQAGRPEFAAGERFSYCNACYDMLAVIVSRVSGQDFADFLETRIFEALHMDDSFVYRPKPGRAPASTARSYSPQRGRMVADSRHLLDGIVGSGGVFSSSADLFAWDQALYSDQLVPRQLLRQAFSRGRRANGEAIDYGFGWMIDRYRGTLRLSHTGGWLGSRTYIARYPAQQLTIVLLSNRADFERWNLGERLADIYLDFARQRRGPRTRGEPVAENAAPECTAPETRHLPRMAPAFMMAARPGAAVGGKTLARRNHDGRNEQILRSLRSREATRFRWLEREPRQPAQGCR